ncbi:hypothetical protein G6F54_013907 [Rhizopus delemar]|nr:hypothetical protein G6F54_013907 [Rhizopus delemar]
MFGKETGGRWKRPGFPADCVGVGPSIEGRGGPSLGAAACQPGSRPANVHGKESRERTTMVRAALGTALAMALTACGGGGGGGNVRIDPPPTTPPPTTLPPTTLSTLFFILTSTMESKSPCIM